ncbi:aminotransferase class I/II-fold pyridoxal phosphate-dependent enzyme [Nocardia beijingensis]|uniref:aminotransferase class I/II-fold pyridoxal phosphate-dependent enzyme n=1 Tax=Nocardia beijingensis TaxID=95162 RepID=UPI001893BC9B|nr:aminotransferase class I/II-fold pyridoxal phosphate-dependent enzyme [Nocardia beijingensis]MBF6465634.1 aminotransferase class I/II-fold pyridoxal phosphate-dependent enzyme [Nocardia beijingensis]
MILAAGVGRRLGGPVPKALTPVHGVPIVHRAVECLAAVGVREIVVVVGFRADEVRASVGAEFARARVSYVLADQYDSTNNAYSLYLARHHLTEDTFVLDGDVVFDAEILTRLAAAPHAAASAVSTWRTGMNGAGAIVDREGRIEKFLTAGDSHDTPHRALKTINVHLLRGEYLRTEFVPLLEELIDCDRKNEFYESVLGVTVANGNYAVQAVDCTDLRWWEIDDTSDLIAAEYSFCDAAESLPFLERLHGGYWRFDVADHCLMINPYFPPKALLRQLADDLETSLLNYPLGQTALRQLLTAVTGTPEDQLVVANGASELITVLGRLLDDVVLVVPGFNEYEAVFARKRHHRVELAPPDFEFDVNRCVDTAVRAHAKVVILTSPNNPTSRSIPKEDLLLLSKQLADHDMRLLVDESFIEFCPLESTVQTELHTHPNLTVIKSMSKAYGVGGLRLGYLATADIELRDLVRAELPVWNINGLAEEFLRRLPGFAADFRASLERVRCDRDEFYRELSALPGITVIEPDANFILIRLPSGWHAREVAETMLSRFGILVKDCSGKTMPDAERYIRISCRTGPENSRVATCLAAVLATAATGLDTTVGA